MHHTCTCTTHVHVHAHVHVHVQVHVPVHAHAHAHVHAHAPCPGRGMHVHCMCMCTFTCVCTCTSSGKGCQPCEPPSTTKQQTAAGMELGGSQNPQNPRFGRGRPPPLTLPFGSARLGRSSEIVWRLWSAAQSRLCSPQEAVGVASCGTPEKASFRHVRHFRHFRQADGLQVCLEGHYEVSGGERAVQAHLYAQLDCMPICSLP